MPTHTAHQAFRDIPGARRAKSCRTVAATLSLAAAAILGRPHDAAAGTLFEVDLPGVTTQPGERIVALQVEAHGNVASVRNMAPGWTYQVANIQNCTTRYRTRILIGAAALELPADADRLRGFLQLATSDDAPQPELRGTATLVRWTASGREHRRTLRLPSAARTVRTDAPALAGEC